MSGPSTDHKTACLVGAFAASLVGAYAAILAVFITSTQMVIDPATRAAVDAPWWTLFHTVDGVLVLGFSSAALGGGWLTWHLCRRAFRPARGEPHAALQRTNFPGR